MSALSAGRSLLRGLNTVMMRVNVIFNSFCLFVGVFDGRPSAAVEDQTTVPTLQIPGKLAPFIRS